MFFRRAMPMVARSVVGVQVRTKYDMSVIKHFHSPQHVGKLDADKTSVGTGVHGSAACGDLARIQIEYDDKTGLISDAAFKTFGCGSAIAASSYACGALIGKSLNQVLEVTNSSIVTALKLPPVKKHCSLLTEGCVRKAVKDLLKKRPELKEKIDTDRLATLDM